MVNTYRGTREIAHSGSTAGYSTYLARYPDLGNLSIAVMCNAAGANATSYTRALVDALNPSLPRATPADTVPLDRAALLPWRGLYTDGRWNSVSVLDTADGTVKLGNAPLRALRDGTYLAGGQRLRLTMGTDGRTRTLRTVTSDGDSVVHTWRTESAWKPTVAELGAYTGRYRNDEIAVTFTVAVSNGRLTVSPRPQATDTLTATHRDAFEGGGQAVWFTRDKRGRVTAMHFGASRVWDFVSERVP
jgi:hypothetical protein